MKTIQHCGINPLILAKKHTHQTNNKWKWMDSIFIHSFHALWPRGSIFPFPPFFRCFPSYWIHQQWKKRPKKAINEEGWDIQNNIYENILFNKYSIMCVGSSPTFVGFTQTLEWLLSGLLAHSYTIRNVPKLCQCHFFKPIINIHLFIIIPLIIIIFT